MLNIPAAEKALFEALIVGNARRYDLSPDNYLRKVWYHEQASVVGEYIAGTFVDELIRLAPALPEWYEEGGKAEAKDKDKV